jgi:hypothetical protein
MDDERFVEHEEERDENDVAEKDDEDQRQDRLRRESRPHSGEEAPDANHGFNSFDHNAAVDAAQRLASVPSGGGTRSELLRGFMLNTITSESATYC